MGPRRNLIAALVVACLGYIAIQWLGRPTIERAVDRAFEELGTEWSWRFGDEAPSHPGAARPALPPGSPFPPRPPRRPRPPLPPWPVLGDQDALLGLGAIQARHQERLLALDGVTGLGIGWSGSGAPVLKLYVTPLSSPLAELAAEIAGLPIEVVEAGPFFAGPDPVTVGPGPLPAGARTAAGTAAAGADPVVRTDRFDRPVPMGISTGHFNATAGTIGAVATDGERRFALSNWHVFVPGGEGRIGDALLQPGPVDGGVAPADVIGTLWAFEPVALSPLASNRIDAALARSDDVLPRTPSDGYGSPRTRTLEARPGLPVQKYGRTTGLTRGSVESINTTINVTYGSADSRTARFTGQIVICCDFSAGGDSGSLIVAHDVDEDGDPGADDRRPVGLLFAGDGTRTIANPIDLVLEAFEVTIVGEDDS